VDLAGGDKKAGNILKSVSGWAENGNVDAVGFSALPGGICNSGGTFSAVGKLGNWWSATETSTSSAYLRSMVYNYAGVGRSISGKTLLFSVRCVQD